MNGFQKKIPSFDGCPVTSKLSFVRLEWSMVTIWQYSDLLVQMEGQELHARMIVFDISLVLLHVMMQISKLSMIPVVCVLEWMLHSKTYTKQVKLAVFVTMMGVGVCTVTDVHINFKGFMAAVVAVLTTSLQQIVSYFGSLNTSIPCKFAFLSEHSVCCILMLSHAIRLRSVSHL